MLLPALLAWVPAAGAACAGAESGAGATDGRPAATAAAPASAEDGPPGAPVRPGIEVLLADSFHLVADRRVGLITNHTGLSRAGRPSIDLLREREGTELVSLFAPEHGIRGDAEGDLVGETDARTGLPIHSLYGATRKPTPAMLEGIEVLLFDIQDVGARYYTYISTMALAMEAAGEAGIPFVVLDRPNPVGGEHVQGNVLDPAHRSFVGAYPVPMRHGMTPGELARLFAGEFGVRVDLRVVPAAGWRRSVWLDATGLPWVPPSPNMPALESAAHYPGTCLFEGTNLSVGRGTERAFQQIGAPWLDGRELALRLNALGLPGVWFEAVTFTPRGPGDGKYDGVTVRGVRLHVTDRAVYDPPATAVHAIAEARRLAGSGWAWRPEHFDRLAGNGRLRAAVEEGRPAREIVAVWREERERFLALRAGYLLYP